MALRVPQGSRNTMQLVKLVVICAYRFHGCDISYVISFNVGSPRATQAVRMQQKSLNVNERQKYDATTLESAVSEDSLSQAQSLKATGTVDVEPLYTHALGLTLRVLGHVDTAAACSPFTSPRRPTVAYVNAVRPKTGDMKTQHQSVPNRFWYDLPCCVHCNPRCRLSASPATGLVGIQENAFLSDYFECLGLFPLVSER